MNLRLVRARAVSLAAILLIASLLLSVSALSAKASESPYLDGLEIERSSAGFVHPGVFVGLPQLESVRRKIVQKQEPQTSIYQWMLKSKQGLINRKPVWDVYSDAVDPSKTCSPRSGNGCIMSAGFDGDGGREHTDRSKRNMSYQINSAYANALLYYYSGGKEKYAQNAIRMLNAYAHTFKGFTSSPSNSHVGDLFAAWMAQILVRAAEIIRYTYSPGEGDVAFDVDAFEEMLRTAFVPRLQSGTENVNNWRTSAAEGLMNIGVFLDDRAIYERALDIWRDVTPSYIYLKSDGPRPASLMRGTDAQLDCRWANNRVDACKTHPKRSPGIEYQNGQNQEICRDMWHASAGVGGIINAAETAFLQGDDLYAEEELRIKTGLSYMIQLSQNVEAAGYPSDFCGKDTDVSRSTGGQDGLPNDWASTEPLSVVVARNHYSDRLGGSFSSIAIPGYADSVGDPISEYVSTHRSGPKDAYGYVTAWQVLTHRGLGEGVPSSAEPLDGPTPSASASPPSSQPQGALRTLLLIGGGVITMVAIAVFVHWRHRGRSRDRSATPIR